MNPRLRLPSGPQSVRLVLLLVDCRQLTRGVVAHSSTSNDSFFMALQRTRVEPVWCPAKPTVYSGRGRASGQDAHISTVGLRAFDTALRLLGSCASNEAREELR